MQTRATAKPHTPAERKRDRRNREETHTVCNRLPVALTRTFLWFSLEMMSTKVNTCLYIIRIDNIYITEISMSVLKRFINEISTSLHISIYNRKYMSNINCLE